MDDMCTHGHCRSRRAGRSVFGESLIALAALLGFVAPYALGYELSMSDTWTYAAFLGIIVVFYFLILLAHFIFIAMADGMGHGLEWATFAEAQKEKEEARKK
jgi:hypothetical protein